jgi:hypothetical protein
MDGNKGRTKSRGAAPRRAAGRRGGVGGKKGASEGCCCCCGCGCGGCGCGCGERRPRRAQGAALSAE